MSMFVRSSVHKFSFPHTTLHPLILEPNYFPTIAQKVANGGRHEIIGHVYEQDGTTYDEQPIHLDIFDLVFANSASHMTRCLTFQSIWNQLGSL